jgi:hypothetical protein
MLFTIWSESRLIDARETGEALNLRYVYPRKSSALKLRFAGLAGDTPSINVRSVT